MIRGILFDLDGTLVQTEILKAKSYAEAVQRLSPQPPETDAVLQAFESVVGLPRQQVSLHLVQRFGLEAAARKQMKTLGVQSPWQVLAYYRMQIYQKQISDPEVIREHLCPFNIALLHWARKRKYCTGLATMSHREQALPLLNNLHLKDQFDFIATRDDVELGKPDPEIYRLVASELNLLPAQCLVVEDSVAGIRAALNAGMWSVVVTNQFTRRAVHNSGLLTAKWIVDEPAVLEKTVKDLLLDLQAA